MRTPSTIWLVVAAAIAASAASSAFAAPTAAPATPAADALVLLGMTYDAQGITFQVPSGGCTSKRTLALNVTHPAASNGVSVEPLRLRLSRSQPDPCEAFLPNGVLIRYTFQEIGIPAGQFTVDNRIQPGTIEAHRADPPQSR